ncbi:hypothetical protein D6C86_05492 [Aureobasidium pullulans]|uniref:Gem-associated protein 5 TPR domain-containing protein n=1 Tax=Aureobasidium pullulans TaxID=5580 RepID=A0A4S9W549_AURPU|nr:hypothetical protein D6C94_03240 [Aureobasidium pullulans]THZ44687.1 hypothetical protein D6C87_03387 [Aureobasidium pullulans]THZ59796.1 hypothetical protein D6C86_05492 [Aureobasidium pullulans]
MSTGRPSGQRSHSAVRRQATTKPNPPQSSFTPDPDVEFQPCAATASFFLYAQRNIILCLHHDTLAIERRFDRHQEDVLWIHADTVSERGAGRLAVSYDTGHTAIVWDISTGDEIARFAAYEHIRVAAWMKNGNIAFGNAQGNVILFEPSTSEHISARTIYDPITAIAPAADSRTFAIGFLNGSILIATLQPLFTIVHSLTTSKAPSRIAGLSWHGSSSRQKSDMLATQTADGDLRVWSIPKTAVIGETPNIIRILKTRSWDVRTKNVSFQSVPTVDNILGVACYGPSSTLFTLGPNHTVQQYDVNPSETPIQVASIQHAPGPLPPSPPNSIEEQKKEETARRQAAANAASAPFAFMDADLSEGELGTMSPLEKIAKEMDQLEEEKQDRLGALSPTSSKTSSEMLSVVFGWNDDIESLVRDEFMRQRPGSASGVLLSKWLGEFGADTMAAMVGSENMTSSDWMLLALSSMGPSSGKQVGQAFVQRLLAKGDIHPAVAVLLGFGEHDDAIEVYVSRGYHMEAVLLTCLTMPSDWQRQSYLVRKWGEALVMQGRPELAVRCFSCISIETSDSWSSPRAQDAVFSSQREQGIGPSPLSPPLSPPFAVGSNRKLTRNGSLKLITTFGDKGVPLLLPCADQRTPLAGMLGVGVTPIAESAISPGGVAPWLRSSHKFDRDPSSARTATPGGYARRQLPSRSGVSRTRDTSQTPLTARREVSDSAHIAGTLDQRKLGHSRNPSSVVSANSSQSLEQAKKQTSSSNRLPSPSSDVFSRLKSESRTRNGSRERANSDLQVKVYDTTYLAPQAFLESANQSSQSDPFVAPHQNQDEPFSNAMDFRGRPAKRYINPPRRSPSSPIPMSPDEVMASRAMAAAATADESYYRESTPQRRVSNAGRTSRANSQVPNRVREPSQVDQRLPANVRERSKSRTPARPPVHLPSIPHEISGDSNAGRSESRQRLNVKKSRAASVSDHTGVQALGYSRKSLDEDSSASETPEEGIARPRDLRTLTKKQLAARELEERRASLARRPSAPAIPLPSDFKTPPRRPFMPPRHHTELGDAPSSFMPPYSGNQITRSHTADPESKGRFPPTRNTGTSTPTAPIGLPATPRAMRHPRYMSADSSDREDVPAIPQVPETPPQLSSATFHQDSPSPRSAEDDIAPLLPSTVFGQVTSQAIPRSSSAPPEMNMDGTPWHYKTVLPHSARRGSVNKGGHSRKLTPTENDLQPQQSPSSSRPSIDQTLHDAQIIIVEESELMLPELQHLAGPPPPPPPPLMANRGSGLGVINIAIGEEEPMVIDVLPTIDRAGALTAPPLNNFAQAQAQAQAQMQAQAQRRGRGSISEGINSRFRSVTERMRNNSKNRTKSPPIDAYAPSPYETVLPSMFSRQQSQPENILTRTRSPYETSSIAVSAAASDASLSLQNAMHPPPPPPPPAPGMPMEQYKNGGESINGYPHPREVRANIPTETLLSAGVYQPDNMF